MCPPGTYQLTTITQRQECTDCPFGTIQPYSGQTRCLNCPRSGVNCLNKGAIDVLPGWFMPSMANDSTRHNVSASDGGDDAGGDLEGRVTHVSVWRCAREEACLGGVVAGAESCADGHESALCGTCSSGFYRSRSQCKSCVAYEGEDAGGRLRESIVVVGTICALVALAAGVYLVYGQAAAYKPVDKVGVASGGAATKGRGRRTRTRHMLGKMVRLLPKRIAAGAALLRIALGFCQCLAVTRHFVRVQWPDVFSNFIAALDQLTLEVFDLVPAECTVGQRLGYHIELIATLGTPVLLLLLLLLLATLVGPCAGRHCCSLRNWPQIWDLAVWLALIQYPTLSRKTLSVFDCLEYRDDAALLRADPALPCYDTYWTALAAAASIGAVVYCVGFPLVAYLLARRFHSGSPGVRRLVRVLTNYYRDDVWWMESVRRCGSDTRIPWSLHLAAQRGPQAQT